MNLESHQRRFWINGSPGGSHLISEPIGRHPDTVVVNTDLRFEALAK
jgi:hypothetical protein